jgi:hypothetical protein
MGFGPKARCFSGKGNSDGKNGERLKEMWRSSPLIHSLLGLLRPRHIVAALHRLIYEDQRMADPYLLFQPLTANPLSKLK